MADKTTTIKLSKEVKSRIDHLRVYPKESYVEILERVLEILNICRVNPVRARGKLILMDRQRKMNGLDKEVKKDSNAKVSISIKSDLGEENALS